MCLRDVVVDMLTEKLVDDFYDQGRDLKGYSDAVDSSLKQLQSLISADKWDLLDRIETHAVDVATEELRNFARFAARIMLDGIRMDQPLKTIH